MGQVIPFIRPVPRESELLELSPRDEDELKRYFDGPVLVVPGTSSGFGAQCERLGKTVNPNTKHMNRPRCPDCGRRAQETFCRAKLPGGGWCGARMYMPEPIDAHGSYSNVKLGTAEDAVINYIDTKSRRTKVAMVMWVSETEGTMGQRFAPSLNDEQLAALKPFGPLAFVACHTEMADEVSMVFPAPSGLRWWDGRAWSLAEAVRASKNKASKEDKRKEAANMVRHVKDEAEATFAKAADRFARARASLRAW